MRDLHQDIQKRIAKFNGISALVLTLFVMISVWGEWHTMALIGVVNALVVASNMFVTFVLLSRISRGAAEVTRGLINLSTGAVIGHLAGWPLACFLWLPYTALVNDSLAKRTAVGMVIATCTVYGVASYLDGVPPATPFLFSALAFFCYEISRSRHAVIRVMLGEAEAGRDALTKAYESLKAETAARERAELELQQHQKLQAVGRLAAGIAHEINTPVQFVADSVSFMQDGNKRLLALVDRLSALLGEATAALRSFASTSELAQRIDDAHAAEREAADLDYLREELPQACERVLEGVTRVSSIVRSVKQFAHPDKKDCEPTDVNEAVRSTLVIAAHEYRLVADVETSFEPLPPVVCHPGEVNQVLLNLVVNAAHAIEEKQQQTGERGTIRVRTKNNGDHVTIEVADTGSGIPEGIRGRIFEAFFTTKAVGRGTGQGLAVSRAVIEKHHGRLTFESRVGEGTTFLIRLPVTPDMTALPWTRTPRAMQAAA